MQYNGEIEEEFTGTISYTFVVPAMNTPEFQGILDSMIAEGVEIFEDMENEELLREVRLYMMYEFQVGNYMEYLKKEIWQITP